MLIDKFLAMVLCNENKCKKSAIIVDIPKKKTGTNYTDEINTCLIICC